ncbi:cytosolic Fe-S cluster assembly factor CFD1 [Cryptococcus gattii Ru294]|uniref:Nucleotide binding protein, putative n=2 Tax=Cryptococcus gattii TaxID=37769 RepID=E6QZW4_CRYGW|nr:Nucleotide binding protein, putative [Cryptococcus gattii WM276]KIR55890.1 cytosolic Fe-S cluster assembly factor CFD1 [Cryptococcus gattii Ru294]KIR77426.1 cytosolic Fe-S cluster assembly factor CFD1 [Cryptococcus gattii EJB2]KIY36408.1 cytosolic Fe-S cluster assembly factor CFD1 [Cryptococcus gattii E566]KJE05941.1 cytosolic Fe-S cluster assembly factor CFD1 [Cryptococcus gattii NT-10]ADV20091.1 Nucleotide binding protein, putative [Cryptococcus gattii WM276]
MADIIETPVSRRLSSVKNIIIVLSGKGGVGKSSSSVQLALSLLAQSPTNRVGLIDLDITGPSLPRMVGLDTPTATVHQSSAGWVPVYVDQGRRLGVMSIGFLLKDRGDSVVWRGPKKDGMIRQFLSEVRWGDLDYLIIDTPPGTSDEHISLVTHLHPLFTPTVSNPTTPTSILISTPQTTALNDTLKSLSFTRKLSLPVMGLVENMAGYVCPCCGEISDTFGKGGGEAMAQREGVGFLGRVPIDTVLVSLLDAVSKGEVLGEGAVEHSSDEATEGQTNGSTEHFPLLDKYLETASSRVWKDITQKLVDKIEQRKLDTHANLESSSEKPTTA